MIATSLSTLRHGAKASMLRQVAVRSIMAGPTADPAYWPLISSPKLHWARFGRSCYEESPQYERRRLEADLKCAKSRLSHLQEWNQQGLTSEPARQPLDSKFLDQNSPFYLSAPMQQWATGAKQTCSSEPMTEKIAKVQQKIASLEDRVKAIA